MELLNRVRSFLSSHAETSENHLDDRLITRYYKSTKENTMTEIKEMMKEKNGFTLTSTSEIHGELTVEITNKKKAFLVFTVITIAPLKTAVDMSVRTETILFSDFSNSKNIICELYNTLDRRLECIGKGLEKELLQKSLINGDDGR